jgi:hypothetical protein
MSFRKFIAESQLLLEYDAEKTWAQHGKKAVNQAYWNNTQAVDDHPVVKKISHNLDHNLEYEDPHAIHTKDLQGEPIVNTANHELLTHFEAGDPTQNKKYVQHIARMYGNSGINRIEDIRTRVKPALAKFDDLAKRKILPAEHRDIGKVKSLGQLEDLVDAHSEDQSNKELSRAEHEQMKKEATITEHPTYTHVIPHTEKASNYFGRGTRWCTTSSAADEYGMGESAFEDHNSQGPLQIFIPKNPQYKDDKGRQEKYQFHLATNQFMNEKDEPVHSDGTIFGSKFSAPKEILKHVDDYKKSVAQAATTTEAMTHPERAIRTEYMSDHAKPEDFEKMLPTASAVDIHHLTLNRNFTGEHALKVMNENPHSGAKINSVKNDWYDDEHHAALKDHALYKDHDPEVTANVARYYSKRLTPKDLTHLTNKAIDSKSDSIINLLAQHPGTSREDRERLLNETGGSGPYFLAASVHTPPDMLTKLAGHDEHRIAAEAINNHNSPPEAGVAAIQNHEVSGAATWALDKAEAGNKWSEDSRSL